MTQIKGKSGSCDCRIQFNDELVHEANYTCRTYDSPVGIYIAGIYDHILDGQVRNLSYVKNKILKL